MDALTIALASMGNNGGAAPFSASSLTLSGWWKAPYASSPWSGNASAGNSGSRNLTEATNPPGVGSNVGTSGLAAASFNGTNQQLSNALAASNFWSTGAGSFSVLINPSALVAFVSNDATPKIFSDTGSYCGLQISTTGVSLYQYTTGGAVVSTNMSISTGAWQLFQGYWDGTSVGVRKNSATMSVLTNSATKGPTVTTGALKVGCNYNASAFFNGLIGELKLSPNVLTFTDFENDRQDLNTRYGLSL